jgi:hypothetical protein
VTCHLALGNNKIASVQEDILLTAFTAYEGMYTHVGAGPNTIKSTFGKVAVAHLAMGI